MALTALKRHQALVLISLIGLVSILNSVFIVHEYRQTYKNVSSSARVPEPIIIARQILQVQQPAQKPIQKSQNSAGYRLADRVWGRCRNLTVPKISPSVSVFSKYGTLDDKVQLCGIWKVGTTFLKRLFMIKNNKKYIGMHNLYDIPFDVMYSHPAPNKISIRKGGERFLFVRDPYYRVYSGYIDKLLAPNPVFWKFVSLPAIKLLRKGATPESLRCGHDLTFKEYVDYVILMLKDTKPVLLNGKKLRPDGHFDLMHKMCKPCEVNYTFVGKMESFPQDSMELIGQIGMNKTAQLLKENGAYLAAMDAINDTVHQPFDKEFQKGFAKCITKQTALDTAWLKLQARGLIGRKPLSISDAEKLTHAEFLQMALEARSVSTSKERSELKNELMNQMYDTITAEKLEGLRNVYALDFNLFEYDDRPDWLFSRTRSQV